MRHWLFNLDCLKAYLNTLEASMVTMHMGDVTHEGYNCFSQVKSKVSVSGLQSHSPTINKSLSLTNP